LKEKIIRESKKYCLH